MIDIIHLCEKELIFFVAGFDRYDKIRYSPGSFAYMYITGKIDQLNVAVKWLQIDILPLI